MSQLSNKVIHRLTLYHCLLKHSISDNPFISSVQIAELLNLDDSLVRKDIALCSVLGHQKQGYSCAELKKSIEKKLGFTKPKEVFIIGAGNLGMALARFSDFKDYGIKIKALFDNNPEKIDKEINGKKIYPLSKLKKLISQVNIKNVILTVSPEQAQNVAEYAVKCGTQFIWNFTPVILNVPPSVSVYYENIISSFLQMQNNEQ